MVPFTVTIPTARRDKTLTDRLLAERNGSSPGQSRDVSNGSGWGSSRPSPVQSATQEYFDDEDALGRWLTEERCEHVGPARSRELTATHSMRAWKLWAEAAGEYAGSIRRFSESLAARGLSESGANPRAPERGSAAGVAAANLRPPPDRQPGVLNGETG